MKPTTFPESVASVGFAAPGSSRRAAVGSYSSTISFLVIRPGSAVVALVSADVRLLDDFRPALDLDRDEFLELLGATADRLGTLREQLPGNIRGLEYFHCFRMHALDDRLG